MLEEIKFEPSQETMQARQACLGILKQSVSEAEKTNSPLHARKVLAGHTVPLAATLFDYIEKLSVDIIQHQQIIYAHLNDALENLEVEDNSEELLEFALDVQAALKPIATFLQKTVISLPTPEQQTEWSQHMKSFNELIESVDEAIEEASLEDDAVEGADGTFNLGDDEDAKDAQELAEEFEDD